MDAGDAILIDHFKTCTSKTKYTSWFTELKKLNAEAIASSILEFSNNVGLNMIKLVGLGFDRCSIWQGKKMESNILRRRLVPKIALLCETRWSEKYKSIRLFYENFIAIKTALDELAVNKDINSSTRSRAFQLSCASSKDTFVVCLIIISTYSSILEPVFNKLQSVKTNLYTVHQYIKTSLLSILRMHRTQCDRHFNNIFETIKKTTNNLDIEIKIPRPSNKQIAQIITLPHLNNTIEFHYFYHI
ncbi:unnamed protein product [Macrosiphum euphorbiae]|uniref:Uncharacterized protein n=1 Tax=Macrosiphum euphorbiae TaxID=13131 RepID=A0AAV0XS82_9HEMI|nr:unnamed protein product [Macrosiphum euphorbiae]